MSHRLLVSLILLGANLAAIGPILAQEPPAAPPTAPAAAPAAPTPTVQGSDSTASPTQSPAPTSAPAAAPATSPAPGPVSADTLKKARLAGYRPETKNGITMYCQETANIGTRFATKKCLDEQQIKGVMDIQHQQQDSLRKPINCTGGPGCGAS